MGHVTPYTTGCISDRESADLPLIILQTLIEDFHMMHFYIKEQMQLG